MNFEGRVDFIYLKSNQIEPWVACGSQQPQQNNSGADARTGVDIGQVLRSADTVNLLVGRSSSWNE